ncbi:Metalloendoproteinase 5-mmp [Thalictrum thalictroides]|uniref:Metalloendoproteinase 5-mmp n=1 Tax=Thalictrum thalictroides TaxID=46969 RepID=A0A7J6VBG2_THATH|nr:Metalloendoproteinase 5-mmp [Thalictrum thalictroides]
MVSKASRQTVFLLLLLVMFPSSVFSIVPNGQPFEFIQHLEGCHKGMTMKGVHQLKQYLEKFGYLSYNDLATHTNHDEFDGPLESAVKTYQLNYGLNVTGCLDSQTVKEMMEPRCGVPDIIDGRTRMRSGKKNNQYGPLYSFFDRKQKWPPSKTHFTYRLQSRSNLADIKLRGVLWKAFDKWAAVTHFTFTEVEPKTRADIDIGFFRRDHGDHYSFDGPLGVLAHAFAPTDGKLHFDEDEKWSAWWNPDKTEFDLESVGLHEIGHILGLQHSAIPSAVMFSKIGAGVTRRELQQDDILGIRSLYNITG